MTSLDSIALLPACGVRLHRTLRIPDDGGDYPLPPSLGPMAAHVIDRDGLGRPDAPARSCGSASARRGGGRTR